MIGEIPEERAQAHHQAFACFYVEYAPFVAAAVNKVLRGSCDAARVEDLTHDILLRILRALGRSSHRPGGNFKGFVASVAINTVLRGLRDSGRREHILGTRVAYEHAPNRPFDEQLLARLVSESDRALLSGMIALLAEEHRSVLPLFFFEPSISTTSGSWTSPSSSFSSPTTSEAPVVSKTSM